MANYAVSASTLTEGRTVFVRGKLAFARITRLIEGEELAKSDQRKVQNGMNPVGKPHTTATITEAEVTYADPANPTLEEKFVAERRYTSKKNPDTGLNYSIDSKGNNLPAILIPSDAGDGSFVQDTSRQEFAQGLDVTLVLRTFKPKGFNNRGLALEQVIVHETPRYYSAGGVDSKELAARGIVVNGAIQPVQAQPGSGGADAGQGDVSSEVPEGSQIQDGLVLPAPAPAPAPVQAAAPAPQVQAQPEAPAAVAAPQPQAAPASAEESMQEKLARLEAENRQLKDSGSAIGAPGSEGPWADQAQPGITYQS